MAKYLTFANSHKYLHKISFFLPSAKLMGAETRLCRDYANQIDIRIFDVDRTI